MGEQNGVCLMIINSEISACQLIRCFLGICAPLFICWAQLSTDKYPRCIHCMSKPLHTSLAAEELENKDPSKADSFQEQGSVFVRRLIPGSSVCGCLKALRCQCLVLRHKQELENDRLTERTEFEVMPPLFLPHSITISVGNLSG